MDGALTQAIQRGQWVLLDSANLCNPTVLDRLNPMLEPGGQLYLNECGTVNGQPRVIQPHPNFRLFLALDPRYCWAIAGGFGVGKLGFRYTWHGAAECRWKQTGL